ncbi:MAG: protein TolQ [Sphingomonadales bacterium]|nr:protein TolQ [Sphingomonadales bacterium]
MTLLALLSVAPGATLHTGARLDPVKLFLDADIVVQVIMGGLLLASLWVWTIVLSFGFRMGSLRRKSAAYEDEFWKARDLDAFQSGAGKVDLPLSRVVTAGMGEWRRSAGARGDLEGARQRLAVAMDLVVAQEAEKLGDRLNFLATVGSVAPFVGLFGTVWGIMAAFFQIGQEQNSSLAVVAPGIAEALAATAIGLFAAIPAVIAYNRFAHRVNAYEARMQRFADKLHASLGRDLENR